MKERREYAHQFLASGIWQPIRPVWSESLRRIQQKLCEVNKLDFALHKRVRRRIVTRIVTEPEATGVEIDSGASFVLHFRRGKLETF